MSLEDDSLNGTYVVQENILSDIKIRLSTPDKVHKILSDGKSHTLTGMMDADDSIRSLGQLQGVVKRGLKDGWIEESICCECKQSNVFRLKKRKSDKP